MIRDREVGQEQPPHFRPPMAHRFDRPTKPTPLQARAFELIGVGPSV